MSYYQKLKDPRWRIKSAKIIERDNGRCRDCNSTENLQVHHCYYIPGKEPWDYDDDVLISLCPPCHQFRQEREIAAHIALAKILRLLSPKMIEKWAWSIMGQAMQEAALDSKF